MENIEKAKWKVQYSAIDDDSGCDDPKPYVIDESKEYIDYFNEESNYIASTVPEYAMYICRIPEIIRALRKIILLGKGNPGGPLSGAITEAEELLANLDEETKKCIQAGKDICDFRSEIIKNKPLRWNLKKDETFEDKYPEIEARYAEYRKKLKECGMYCD